MRSPELEAVVQALLFVLVMIAHVTVMGFPLTVLFALSTAMPILFPSTFALSVWTFVLMFHLMRWIVERFWGDSSYKLSWLPPWRCWFDSLFGSVALICAVISSTTVTPVGGCLLFWFTYYLQVKRRRRREHTRKFEEEQKRKKNAQKRKKTLPKAKKPMNFVEFQDSPVQRQPKRKPKSKPASAELSEAQKIEQRMQRRLEELERELYGEDE